jgi:hypothetical protein
MTRMTNSGALLALVLVGVVAAAGVVSRRGSAATTRKNLQGWLQRRVDALPSGARATVLYAELVRSTSEGEVYEELAYTLGAPTGLARHSPLRSYHATDLHDIVLDAIGVTGARIEGGEVDWEGDDEGHSVTWSGSIYADGDALSRRVTGSASRVEGRGERR